MSRLYDRLMVHGCRPLNGADVQLMAQAQREDYLDVIREAVAQESGDTLPDEELARLNSKAMRFLEGHESNLSLSPDDLADAVVVSAEEVADYWATMPVGTNILDVLASVAPPFERVFVEFQRKPNNLAGFESWGVLFEDQGRGADGDWVVIASLIGERRKRDAVGPVVRWVLPLDPSGTLRRGDEEGYMSVFADRHRIPAVPEDAQFEYTEMHISYLGAALFAVSLMHCKNVDVRPVDPPERVSRSHQRKHGRPLTRYHVLDIQPMRRVLDGEGEAQSRGLRHALHICRGHFKTYTAEAPLLGRHSGTYWWPAHVRGAADEGVVEKDYRIRLDEGLGREYVEADEHPEIQPTAPEHTGRDPDLGGRGLRAHNATQNLLAQAVRDAGHEPRRPKPDEPQYDLAWEAAQATWVAEVKSVTPQNEERQLRTALGQVLRYRQLLAAEGRTVQALVATEREPSDPSWVTLLEGEGIALVWAPDGLTVGWPPRGRD